jgi:hypothetical protein
MSKLAIIILLAFWPFSSIAIDYQEYLFLHHSNKCSNYFEYFEQKNNIPENLLRSISTVESGRWHSKAKLYLSWPWAVNQGGKAYYFETKKEAIDGVKKMLEQGITNIDIGCMQINLHHHPSAFYNLNQAFEPKDNIEYASSFLKNHYNQSGNWKKAVAAYHSQLPIGEAYAEKVFKICTNYNSGKLAITPCTSDSGKLVSCKATTDSKIYSSEPKEILPLDSRNIKLSSMKLRKFKAP